MDERACLWMTAGIVAYKLCDHGFDCEHCPFDAALRGERLPAELSSNGPSTLPPTAVSFPDDRLYGTGHTWALRLSDTDRDAGSDAHSQAGPDPLVRLGLDAFAAALLRGVRAVRRADTAEAAVATGAPLCTLDLGAGSLPVPSPFACRPRCWNRSLDGCADAVATSPYDDGWLVEVVPDGAWPESTPGPGLVPAATALERTRLDLRRLRRRVGLFLLADDEAAGGEVGPTMVDGGEPITDLRFILGPERYLELVRDLLG